MTYQQNCGLKPKVLVRALPYMESSGLQSDLSANRSIAHPINQTNQSDVAVEAVQSETALRVAFSLIACSAFVLNLMFCVVLFKKPAMMKKPYNTLLFNLAVTDLFTAILLVVTPGYVADEPLFPISADFSGVMFCAILANRLLLFAVAKVSILLVTCLAVERWYSVMRPIKYKTQFGRKRRILYTVLSWIVSCTLQVHKLFEKELVGNECATVNAPYGEQGSQAFTAMYSFTNFMIPCLVTWFIFAHIKLRMPETPNSTQLSERRKIQQKMLLRLCALTAAVFTICWLPAQLSYTLSPFGITDIKSTVHKSWNVVAFLNSCLNPLIYWHFHKEYQREFIKLFCTCKMPHCIIPSSVRSVSYHIEHPSKVSEHYSVYSGPYF